MERRVTFCCSVAVDASPSRSAQGMSTPAPSPARPRRNSFNRNSDSDSDNRRNEHDHRHRRRRRNASSVAGFPPVAVMLLFLHVVLFAVISFLPAGIEAREIVATNEWQKLSENDTVPAGLHVKIDITTGEKWAKLPSEDENEDEESIKGTVYDASINADGSVSATAVAVNPDSPDKSSSSTEDNTISSEKAPNYDYEMMHRTLSKLPDDEMERYGGLPALPSGSGKTVSPEEREAFEEKMASIWKQRQEEIQNVQEEFMADMPKMLLQRIRHVKGYLENPREHRETLLQDRLAAKQEESSDNEDNAHVVSDIVEVLKDVEYHVTDVDHARDFHTLGGWPVLVSLLTDALHYPSTGLDDDINSSAATALLTDEDRGIVDEIQSAAAWAVGSAVKNHEEFHSWALEDLSQAFDPPAPKPVTAVSLLLANIEAYNTDDASSSLSTAAQSKRQKCLYAIASLVRANPTAAQQFLELNGPAILGTSLDRIMSANGDISPADAKFASKILGLGEDLLGDVLINDNSNGGANTAGNKQLIESLTTQSWCHSAVALVSKGRSMQVRERSLNAMQSMAPFCQFSQGDRKAVQEIGAELHDGGSDGSLADLEPEIKAEFVQLVDSILQEMDKAGQQ